MDNNEHLQGRSVRGVQKLFEEVIQDLIIRFILCCPEEEHESFDRLFFQIEEAHWFYLDFYRQNHPKLPALNFKQFAETIFSHCPLLQPYSHLVHQYRSGWVQYKTSVPVCGAIILNRTMDRVLMVKGIGSSASWSFPRGKINKDESSKSCAIREVREETSMDISDVITENEFIEMTFNEQRVRLFIVVLGCHESELAPFAPQTRGEISKIDWLHIDNDILQAHTGADKKKRFWNVAPFLRDTKTWIKKRRATVPVASATSPAKQRTSKKPSKRSGKNNARMMGTEIDFHVPTPRSAPKSKPVPLAILKRGESLGNSQTQVASSYTPPSHMVPPNESQFFSWSPSSTQPILHSMPNSFHNFAFNADEIMVGFSHS